MTYRIVVLGAGYAGLGAAKRIARRLRRAEVTVTLVNATDQFVERVRLHQLAAGQQLGVHPLHDLLAGTGVELVVAQVTGIDAERQTVALNAPPHTVGYDMLVYALGSRADVGAVPGVAESCFAIAEVAEAMRLQPRAAQIAGAGGLLTVVGGGLTGIEAAAELAETHDRLRVRLVTSGEFGGWLSGRAQRHLRSAFDRWDIEVHEHTTVGEARGGVLVTSGGTPLGADAILWAAGFRVSQLAQAAGFAVDRRGRMIVDETLRSVSHPQVYGIGDAAAARTRGGTESRMSCQTGLPMGQRVADIIVRRLTGREPQPLRLRYVWINISLGRRDGITQFTHADDSPRRAILTGHAAARFKEIITRSTVTVMRHPGPYVPARPVGISNEKARP
ncbi:MAG: NAD(P)/FAD-dependent oxidoreductase [Pseudonocardiaceae bacterium]